MGQGGLLEVVFQVTPLAYIFYATDYGITNRTSMGKVLSEARLSRCTYQPSRSMGILVAR